MKIPLSLFIGLLFIQLAVAQSNSFYDKILDYDNCKNCYFVVIEVKSKPYTGKVLIENDDLQDFINKTEKIDKAKYKEYMKDILLNKKNIFVKNAYLKGSFLDVKNVSEHQFRLLNESKEVNEVVSKGCVPFIKYYFLGESLDSITNTESRDCKEFIRSQNKNLFLSRSNAGFLKEQNTIINKLFEWEIPTRIDDYSGWLVIDKASFQKASNIKK